MMQSQMPARMLEALMAIGAIVVIGVLVVLALPTLVRFALPASLTEFLGWEDLDDIVDGPRPPEPKTPFASWLKSDDYPMEALRNGWEGTSAVRFTIDMHGRAVRCHAVKSSGHSILDEAACRAIMDRARYAPARDGSGRRMEVIANRRVTWRIPE